MATAKQSKTTSRIKGVKSIVNKELAPFSRQLSSLLRAGMSLIMSLSTIEDQIVHAGFRQVIATIRMSVEGGGSFSDGLARFPAIFNDLFVNIVRSGERSGEFADAMGRLSKMLESTARLRRKVRSALAYPTVVLIMAVGIGTAMIIFVMPIFGDMFADFGHALPAPTQFLIDLSHFIRRNWWIILIVIVLAVVFFRRWHATPRGAFLFDRFKLRLPVIGPLTQRVSIARFAAIFSQMLHSGVPILDALRIVAAACGNQVIGKAILDARVTVERGENLSLGLEGKEGIPLLVVRMIAAGERSGKIDEMLDSVAATYEDEVETMLATLTSLMEPIMMAVIGVIIGGIVIAMYLPIFTMSSIVAG